MVGSIEATNGSLHSNGSVQNLIGLDEKLDELRQIVGKADVDPLRIVGVGAVFCSCLQDSDGQFWDKIQIRIWRRAGRAIDRATAEHRFEGIKSRER